MKKFVESSGLNSLLVHWWTLQGSEPDGPQQWGHVPESLIPCEAFGADHATQAFETVGSLPESQTTEMAPFHLDWGHVSGIAARFLYRVTCVPDGPRSWRRRLFLIEDGEGALSHDVNYAVLPKSWRDAS